MHDLVATVHRVVSVKGMHTILVILYIIVFVESVMHNVM